MTVCPRCPYCRHPRDGHRGDILSGDRPHYVCLHPDCQCVVEVIRGELVRWNPGQTPTQGSDIVPEDPYETPVCTTARAYSGQSDISYSVPGGGIATSKVAVDVAAGVPLYPHPDGLLWPMPPPPKHPVPSGVRWAWCVGLPNGDEMVIYTDDRLGRFGWQWYTFVAPGTAAAIVEALNAGPKAAGG